MRDWLIGLGVATVGVIVSWAVLVLLDAWPGEPRLLLRLLGS
ncbi:hypothetical protein O7607_27005 [Micromonospora sp. WMMA1949]|nr:hypothetical protein [Micromonospora sp. WMMA1949]MCZ7429413.1 hypothetical protein [Micromonospora sp. WMMA1949]